jgi:hypothetical protein
MTVDITVIFGGRRDGGAGDRRRRSRERQFRADVRLSRIVNDDGGDDEDDGTVRKATFRNLSTGKCRARKKQF